LSNFIDVTSNTIHFGDNGAALSSGDIIFVSTGVALEGLTTGATTGNVWDGIDATQTTGAGITATIEGTVAGSFDGISVDHVGGNNITIGNAGIVTSLSNVSNGGYGIYLGDANNIVFNAGQIMGANGGIHAAGAGNNAISNTGLIESSSSIALYLDGFGNTIQNTGTIAGSAGDIAIALGSFGNTTSGSTITNAGQIFGAVDVVLTTQANEINWITNTGVIQSTSDSAITNVGAGMLVVNNDGNIAGEIEYAAAYGDILDNTGVVRSTGDAVSEVGGAFTLDNSGAISASGSNALVTTGGSNVIKNSAGGVISSNGDAILLNSGTDIVTNHGEISGDVSAVTIDGIGINKVTNSGSLSASGGAGLIVDGFLNTIINTGKVTGYTSGVEIGLNGGGTNVLNNTGTIIGGTGVFIAAGGGDKILNAGLISGIAGVSGDGISSSTSDVVTISNTGTISGDHALDLSAVSGVVDVVHNGGTLSSTGGVAISLTGPGAIDVYNTGHISGDVDLGQAASLYNGVNGTLDGAVNGSDGSDTIKGGADGETLNGAGGNDLIKGGTGDDTIAGGSGGDKLYGGGGHDTFVYTNATESRESPSTHDTIVGFDALLDTFDFEVAVTGVDKAVTAGTVDKAAFNADLQKILNATALHAHHAVLVTPNAGDLAGHTYLVVDDNGTAGYQAQSDYVIELSQGAHLASLSVDNFI
jgi:hypothetical protein